MDIMTKINIQTQRSTFIIFLNTDWTGKFLEELMMHIYVMYLRPTLNKQLELTSLTLFQNEVMKNNVFKLIYVSLELYWL